MTKRHTSTPAIVFDFGRVLIDWDPHYLYRKFFDGDDKAIDRFLQEVHFFEWVIQQDAGRPFRDSVAEICGLYPQYCELFEAYDKRYEETISGPIWPTVTILGELKTAGYPLYGLSNWPAEKFPGIREKYEFFDWFDDIIISGEVKLAKPDPHIFQLTLARIGRPAQECLLIDDSAQNVQAARQLGYQTIQFQSPAQLSQALASLGILAGEKPPANLA